MTTATLARLPSLPNWAVQFARYVTDVVAGVVEAREIAIRYERLTHLSNTDLARLGLTRQDIPNAAVNGVAGL
jgi:hypothetical protein